MANKHAVSIGKKTHNQLTTLSQQNAQSKASIVSQLIDAVCSGNMSVADAARAIINARKEE